MLESNSKKSNNVYYPGFVFVRPSIRRDGAIVRAHIRTKADGIKENNFSFRRNKNGR